MSGVNVTSGSLSPGMKLPPISIRTNPPPPQQWTLVKEFNMEKRENFQDWQVNVAVHLKQMKDQLTSYSDFINMLDKEIEETKKNWTTREETEDGKDDSSIKETTEVKNSTDNDLQEKET